MQGTITKAIATAALLLLAGTAWAVDYSKMSNDELSARRGTLAGATAEDWNAFHTEWWKRLSQMSPEERQKYMGPGMGRGMGQGQGMGKGMGPGKGMGKGKGRGMGCPCWSGPPPCWNGAAPSGQAPTGPAPSAPTPGK